VHERGHELTDQPGGLTHGAEGGGVAAAGQRAHVGDRDLLPVRAPQPAGDRSGGRHGLDAAHVAADAGVVGRPAHADVADVARRAVGAVVQHALAGDEAAADAGADLDEQQRHLVGR
jgi:hypothetical protein